MHDGQSILYGNLACCGYANNNSRISLPSRAYLASFWISSSSFCCPRPVRVHVTAAEAHLISHTSAISRMHSSWMNTFSSKAIIILLCTTVDASALDHHIGPLQGQRSAQPPRRQGILLVISVMPTEQIPQMLLADLALPLQAVAEALGGCWNWGGCWLWGFTEKATERLRRPRGHIAANRH